MNGWLLLTVVSSQSWDLAMISRTVKQDLCMPDKPHLPVPRQQLEGIPVSCGRVELIPCPRVVSRIYSAYSDVIAPSQAAHLSGPSVSMTMAGRWLFSLPAPR